MTLKDTAGNTVAHCVLCESCQNGWHCGRKMMVCRSDVPLETWTLIDRPLPCVAWHEPPSVYASTCSVFRKQVSPSGDVTRGLGSVLQRIATGGTIRVSNPGRGKSFLILMSYRQTLGPNQSPLQWVQALLSGDKAAGTCCWLPTAICV